MHGLQRKNQVCVQCLWVNEAVRVRFSHLKGFQHALDSVAAHFDIALELEVSA